MRSYENLSRKSQLIGCLNPMRARERTVPWRNNTAKQNAKYLQFCLVWSLPRLKFNRHADDKSNAAY